jgi:hypothetical protein
MAEKKNKTKKPNQKIIRKRKKVEDVNDDIVENEIETIEEETSEEELAPEETLPIFEGEFDEDEVVQNDEDLNFFEDPKSLTAVTSDQLAVSIHEASSNEKDLSEFFPKDLQESDLRNKVTELVNEIENKCFEIGRILYYIEENSLYKEWGYNSLSGYLESGEIKSQRTCYYLVNIHRWFVEDIKDRDLIEDLKKIGWTKDKEILACWNEKKKKNFTEEELRQELPNWIKLAQELPVKKLNEQLTGKAQEKKTKKVLATDGTEVEIEIKEEKDSTETPKDNDYKEVRTFSFYAEQWETVNRALSFAGKEARSDKPSHLLTLICQSFLNDIDLAEDYASARINILRRVESQLKVKLVAIEEKNEEIIYGQELLE